MRTRRSGGRVASLAILISFGRHPDLPPTATLAAELGALAFKSAYAQWGEPGGVDDLGELACAALRDLKAAAAQLT